MIADADADIPGDLGPSIGSARQELLLTRPDCILVDLNLPDATGMDAVARIASRDPPLPIVVLTGLDDEHFRRHRRSLRRAGLPGQGPRRTRHPAPVAAVRHRAQTFELTAVDLSTPANCAPRERPTRTRFCPPRCSTPTGVQIVTQYRQSRENALLGGDFYDVVQTPDGTVHIMVGDVAGHGPDEAALGAALRIAWRALTFAGPAR